MKARVLRICLLWLMILIIPAQAIAGAFSASCTAAPEVMQQAEMATEHAHHAMAEQADADIGDAGHSGCVLCAVSCHGISALTNCNTVPLAVLAPVLSDATAYLLFVGRAPEPLERPPRTVLL